MARKAAYFNRAQISQGEVEDLQAELVETKAALLTAASEAERLRAVQRGAVEAAYREGFADGKTFEVADYAWLRSPLNGAEYDPAASLAIPAPAQAEPAALRRAGRCEFPNCGGGCLECQAPPPPAGEKTP